MSSNRTLSVGRTETGLCIFRYSVISFVTFCIFKNSNLKIFNEVFYTSRRCESQALLIHISISCENIPKLACLPNLLLPIYVCCSAWQFKGTLHFFFLVFTITFGSFEGMRVYVWANKCPYFIVIPLYHRQLVFIAFYLSTSAEFFPLHLLISRQYFLTAPETISPYCTET